MITPNTYLQPHRLRLWELTLQLGVEFKEMRARKKEKVGIAVFDEDPTNRTTVSHFKTEGVEVVVPDTSECPVGMSRQANIQLAPASEARSKRKRAASLITEGPRKKTLRASSIVYIFCEFVECLHHELTVNHMQPPTCEPQAAIMHIFLFFLCIVIFFVFFPFHSISFICIHFVYFHFVYFHFNNFRISFDYLLACSRCPVILRIFEFCLARTRGYINPFLQLSTCQAGDTSSERINVIRITIV
ncbi:hypothetical protein EW026_g4707 [Hermanssonia centrifuga]|uniref:Uncharacterized protein n=1 Tax=Hermanssonia centrifuga TaxID=98765 RepID=A0A4S4KGB1_9APHY|nr:hypothetical protein EW026_g4707 [Hermanssonia centrifuga]